ncbi:hypothetical protein Acr_13g0007900 [Actinidia rufa]|uniref:Uncharacterized protein n=1 Tax=Actinidia rufa TaxID=165716 RepID=A0A7J0FMK2_9ERIC|nr:hypothetical protein Acr_13g0007900 [Actinidia rufa]
MSGVSTPCSPCCPLLPTCSPCCPELSVAVLDAPDMVILTFPYIGNPRVGVCHTCESVLDFSTTILLELPAAPLLPFGASCSLLELSATFKSFLLPPKAFCSLLELPTAS